MNEVQGVEQPKIGAEHVRSCLIVLFIAMAVCTLPIWLPKLLLIGNQAKWQLSGVENYTLTVYTVGIRHWPEEYELKGTGDILFPQTRSDIRVEELFNEAWSCILFCLADYDPQYGYPTKVGSFFLEGGWLETSLQVIEP